MNSQNAPIVYTFIFYITNEKLRTKITLTNNQKQFVHKKTFKNIFKLQ